MPESENSDLSERMRRLVEITDIAEVLTEPLKKSIENLLKFSSEEIGSGEASVLIREGDRGDLRFLTAIGEVAETLLSLKIPAGKGIAGFVISSGQPMAITDVESEDSFYKEVDQMTGFSTQTILATPLRHNGEVIGVLEYINRRGEPPFEAWTPEEMDRAGLFADAIAPLVDAFEAALIFDEFGGRMLAGTIGEGIAETRRQLAELRGSAEHRETMDLAVLLQEVASRGDAEKQLCRELLEMILRFSDRQTSTDFLSF